MKYQISFDKDEFDAFKYDLKTRSETEGFWKSIDLLYQIYITGQDKTCFGKNVTNEQKKKFNNIANILVETFKK